MRYPTRNGLIIPPYELGFTVPSIEDLQTRRKTTNHHGYYDKAWYQSRPYRQVFRSLVTHVYPMLATEHNSGINTLHDKFSAPIMPKDALMIDVVDEYLALHGVIDCAREGNTREHYTITAEQWEAKKQIYKRSTE